MARQLSVCILGMGYIGTTTAASLAHLGHPVVGVEKDPAKVQSFRSGEVPFDEPGLQERFQEGLQEGRIRVVEPGPTVLTDADVVMICVGTPSTQSGEVDLSQVLGLIDQLALGLSEGSKDLQVVALRSTSPPGTAERVQEALERRAPGISERVRVVSNPEFLREGSALDDFLSPPFTVIGTGDDDAAALLRELYANVGGPVSITSPRTAELLKYTCNAFHALKVAFANEVGSLATELEVDSTALMHIFTQDDKLNISARYLMPGFAFGGSCLPKDVRALSGLLRARGVSAPLVQSILPSNDAHLGRAADYAMKEIPEGTIGVAGLAFKDGTNDFRESPYVHLVRDLIAAGRSVLVYEPALATHELLGANADFMSRTLPDFRELLVDTPEELVGRAAGVILTRGSLADHFHQEASPILEYFGIGSFQEVGP